MAKDLDRMSFKELQELELKLKKAKASAEDRTRAEVRSKVEALIASAGFKVSDIFGGRGGKGRTVAAKYANPDDPSETWTGRGRKPRWLAAKLKGGDRIEKFLIK
jgi:DNA-binding protein H-NS